MGKSTTKEARQRILDTASRLFYERGIHAVGIDTIVLEAATAKMTLYNHFTSKDELVVAWLEQKDLDYWEWWNKSLSSIAADDHQGRLEAIFTAVVELSRKPQCLGCVFQLSASEYPDLGHPAHQRAMGHKARVIEWFLVETRAAGLVEPERCAHELYLLLEGVWAAVRMFGTVNPARHFLAATRAILRSHQTVSSQAVLRKKAGLRSKRGRRHAV
jgi:AcrR family transcriptional regulator